MNVDPENHVVKLCAAGIEAEMKGDVKEAAALYMHAWRAKTNDYEACIAAHYIARMQTIPADILYWNLQALQHADKVANDSVAAFYPSLYLNIGKAYEDMGKATEAKQYYTSGAARADILPDTDLGNLTKDAISRGLQRLA